MNQLNYDFTHRSALLFVVSLLLYETTTYVANDMIMPGMIAVIKSFSAPDTMVTTALTAFILGGACLQLFLGPLSDRLGRRPVLIFGAAFFLLSTIFVALSQTIGQFILARFFQGMGLCFITVIGYATLQEIYPELQAVRIVAIMSSITVLAPLTGPLFGAFIIHYFSWRMIFVVIAIFATFALLGLCFYMPETIGKRRRDGTIHEPTSLKWTVVRMNYLALLKNKSFILGSIALGLSTIPIIAWIGASPLILIKSAKLSVLWYGIWQIPIFSAAILGNLFLRFSTTHLSLQQIIRLGAYIIISSFLAGVLVALLYQPHYLLIIIVMSFYAFGLGFSSAALNRTTLYSTPVSKGTASALLSIVVMLLTALGNQLAGIIYYDYNNFYFLIYCLVTAAVFFSVYLCMQKNYIQIRGFGYSALAHPIKNKHDEETT